MCRDLYRTGLAFGPIRRTSEGRAGLEASTRRGTSEATVLKALQELKRNSEKVRITISKDGKEILIEGLDA
jgi:hypothetical protein